MEDMELMSNEMVIKRDATHREFYSNVIANYGVEVGSTRVVRILSLIEDILNLNSAYSEIVLVASIFSPGYCDQDLCTSLPNCLPPQ